MAKSAVEQVRALDEQRAKIIAAAKAEAIKKVEKALKELSQCESTAPSSDRAWR